MLLLLPHLILLVLDNLVSTYRLDKVSPIATIFSNYFTGFEVTITKPDGTIESKTNLSTDSTSNGWFTYTPDQVGEYNFQVSFPGQDMIGLGAYGFIFYNQTYLPSESPIIAVTVQSDPIESIPLNPLPTDYWTTPIYGENKGWWQAADNWLMEGYDFPEREFTYDSAFAPYTSAPNSAHVLWTKPILFGGLVGGPFEDGIYYQGLSYEQHYDPIILNGRIIYVEHFADQTTTIGTRCVDLYTGEKYGAWMALPLNSLKY